MASKSNIRSMRFSDEIIQLIEAQEGDTFTAKFEYLVQRCAREMPQKEQELKLIKHQITTERQRLQMLRQKSNGIEKEISSLYLSLRGWRKQTEAAITAIDELANRA